MTNPPPHEPHQPGHSAPHDSYPGMAPAPEPVDPTGPQDSYPGMAPRHTPVDPTGSLPNAHTTPPPTANYGPPVVQATSGSSKGGLLVAVILLVVLLAGGGGAWYFLSDDGSSEEAGGIIGGGNDDPDPEPEPAPDDEGFPMDQRNIHAEEWYNSDWDFVLHIDGEDKPASLTYVDRWDHPDCSNALEESQEPELLEGNDCLYGVEGHYERPDAGFEVCQRVFEFETEGGATMSEVGIEFDEDDIFYSPMTCTRPLDDEVAWDTRVTAHGRYLTVTVGALTQESPSDDDLLEFVRAVGYRHTEISNATLWMD